MLVAIHQPEYLPWLGLIDKAKRADVLVLLDHVQFNRASLQHRAKILGQSGPAWLTIPFVHRYPDRICDVEVADPEWGAKHAASLRNAYGGGRAAGFEAAWPSLRDFLAVSHDRVAAAAVESMWLLFRAFRVAPAGIVRSSDLRVEGVKSALVLAICQRLGATRYLCGRTAADTYLDRDAFAAAGIDVEVQDFVPRLYGDRTPGEPKGLSALDAWMLLGVDAPRLLQ